MTDVLPPGVAFPGVERVAAPGDPRLADYVGLTDVALRSRQEPELGLYLAESEKVIRRALGAGHRPRSLLLAERWLEPMADLVTHVAATGAPVWTGEPAVLEAVTGFHVHRGAIAAMHRPPLRPPVIATPRSSSDTSGGNSATSSRRATSSGHDCSA